MELANLPLDHSLSKDFQQAFRHFEGQRDKAGSKTGGDNQGPVNLILFQKLQSGREQLIRTARTGQGDEMFRNTFFYKIIGRSERDIQCLSQLSLRDRRIFKDRTADDYITIHDRYLRG